jgi:hypothetical protein
MLDDARELATKTAAANFTANAPARTASRHTCWCLPAWLDAPLAQTPPRAWAVPLPAAQGQSVVVEVTFMISATYNVLVSGAGGVRLTWMLDTRVNWQRRTSRQRVRECARGDR